MLFVKTFLLKLPMTDSQRKAYEEYLENFDPSPQNYGDDYSSPLDFDEWMLEMEEADE